MRLKSFCALGYHDRFTAQVRGDENRVLLGVDGDIRKFASPNEWAHLSVIDGFRWLDCGTCQTRTRHYAKGVWE